MLVSRVKIFCGFTATAGVETTGETGCVSVSPLWGLACYDGLWGAEPSASQPQASSGPTAPHRCVPYTTPPAFYLALPSLHAPSCNAPVNSEVRIFKDKARPAPFAYFRSLSQICKNRYYSTSKKQKHPLSVSSFCSVFRASDRKGWTSNNTCATFLVLAGATKIQLTVR